MMAATKPNVVFVLGAPGSGKGTACEFIVENFPFQHLSAGDLLRAERNTPGSQYGEMIETHIRNGTIVPVEITCNLIQKAMTESSSVSFLIDGFPRNEDNLIGWNKVMSQDVNLQFVLFIDCEEQVCIDRCLKRGAAGSGRSDDNIESLKKRFQTYHVDTMPIINHYEAQSLVRKVDGSQAKNKVLEEVKTIFS